MLCSYGLRCWVLQYACSLAVCGTARLLSGAATMFALPLQCMSVLSFLHCCYCLLSFHHFGSMQCPLMEVPLMTDSFQNHFICFIIISRIFILVCLHVYLLVLLGWQSEEHEFPVHHSLPDSNETGLLIEPSKPQSSSSLYLLQQDGSREYPGITCLLMWVLGIWTYVPMRILLLAKSSWLFLYVHLRNACLDANPQPNIRRSSTNSAKDG